MDIYKELTEITHVTRRDDEDFVSFASRLAKSVDKLKDDDWKSLSEEAQEWSNAVILAVDFHKAIAKVEKEDELSRAEAIKKVRAEAKDPKLVASLKGDETDFPELPGMPEIDAAEPEESEEEEEPVDEKSVAKPRKAAAKVAEKKSAKKTVEKSAKPTREAPKRAASKTGNGASAKRLGKRAQIEEAAKAGKLPPTPDFSADTHKAWRPKLAEVVKLVKAGDIKGLKKFEIKPYSSSPKAIDRYRQLAITALSAQK